MNADQPPMLGSAQIRRLYWALVGGLLGIMTVFASLFWFKTAPMLPREGASLIAGAIGTAALLSLGFGWVWARPQIPQSVRGASPADLWLDPNAGARAVLLWVLWEGGTIMATVGTLLTGSLFTGAIAGAGFALLVTRSPGYFESRDGA